MNGLGNPRIAFLAVAALLCLAATPGPSSADVNIGSDDSEAGTVTSSLAALVNITISDAAIAFGTLPTTAGLDTFDDSRGTSAGASDSVALNTSNSNVNVGAYFKRDGLSGVAKAVGTNNVATLRNLDFATDVSTTKSKAGQYFDGTNYYKWSAADANRMQLWAFFDDGYEAGSANPNNDFSQADGAASAYSDNNEFTPYILQLNSTDHQSAVPSTNAEYPAKTWYDGSSPTTADTPLEGGIVYYLENGTTAGREGALQAYYLQVILKAAGDEVMCRTSASATASGNWSALTGWDLARDYSGALNSSSQADDTTCNVLANRYALAFTSTGSPKTVVLAMAVQQPHKINEASFAMTFQLYSALGLPNEAPRLDYTWTPTINAVNWSPVDALANTADNKQYP